jgi:hypothetical protein
MITQLMEDSRIVGMQIPIEYIFRPEVCQHWEQLRNQWKWLDLETSTAEVLWERVALLMDMWKWYGEVIRLAGCEMLKNWKKWMGWLEEKSVPHRWLPGWTSKMTTEEYETLTERQSPDREKLGG